MPKPHKPAADRVRAVLNLYRSVPHDRALIRYLEDVVGEGRRANWLRQAATNLMAMELGLLTSGDAPPAPHSHRYHPAPQAPQPEPASRPAPSASHEAAIDRIAPKIEPHLEETLETKEVSAHDARGGFHDMDIFNKG